MTISTHIIQIHKCPVCGFRTKLGNRYKKEKGKLIFVGKGRYCQHIACNWSDNNLEQLPSLYKREPIKKETEQQRIYREGRG